MGESYPARGFIHRPDAPLRQAVAPSANPDARPSGRKVAVDRVLAGKNLRTGLIAGAICIFAFGIAFFVAAVY